MQEKENNKFSDLKKINVIDIFCGAGGLSYGFYKNEKFKL